jgi:hypothetical protein
MFDGETDHFTYTRIVPVDEPDENQKRIVMTGGAWEGIYDYLYFETTPDDRYLYGLVSIGSNDRLSGSDEWDVIYEPTDAKFYDVGHKNPYQWGVDNTGTNLSAFETAANMPIHYWYDTGGTLKFQFDNPFYVAPPTYVYEFIATEYTQVISLFEIDPTDDLGDFIPYDNSSISFATTPHPSSLGDINDGKYHGSPLGNGSSIFWGPDQLTTPPFSVFTLTLASPIQTLIINAGTEGQFPTTSYFKLNGVTKNPTEIKTFTDDDHIIITYDFSEDFVAPSYRYLAFYGETDNEGAVFQELELTLGTPINGLSEIKYGVNETGITFHESKAWSYISDRNKYSTIMNGVKANTDPRLQYSENINAIFWYMDMGAGVAADVNGGTFWTYFNDGYDFTLGKLYGTNTDPATFTDASLIANYEYVCDLNRQTST